MNALKKIAAVVLINVLVNGQLCNGQVGASSDSIIQKNGFSLSAYKIKRVFTVPVALTAVGLIAKTDNEFFDNDEIKEERDKLLPAFRTQIDDYLQYAPIVAVYGLNAAGKKGKNNFANRTALLIKSEMIMLALTFSLKGIVAEPRPDSGETNSFPSGHTAQAFAAATFLAKEYGHESIWFSVGAYSAAAAIGVLRIMNNRHWLSDIWVGAGIGILSTNIAYLTHQYKWHDRKNRLVFSPAFSTEWRGGYLRYTVR
jgi:membrane-associated phospholipid phosphatase